MLTQRQKLKYKLWPLKQYGYFGRGGKQEWKRYQAITPQEKLLISTISSISPSVIFGLFAGGGNCGYDSLWFILSIGLNPKTGGPKDIRYEIALEAVMYLFF